MNDVTSSDIPFALDSHKENTLIRFRELIRDTALAEITVQEDKVDLQRWLKVMICSDFVARQFSRHKEAIIEQWVAGDYSRVMKKNELSEKLAVCLSHVDTELQLLQQLRIFRNQQMVRICYRDINGLADLNEVLVELTELADCSIRQALQWLDSAQQKEFGSALDSQGKPMQLIAIGMGKLGAYELNFSSDIDLIFAFAEHGETVNGPRSISHNEYFIKLGQRLIKTLDQKTEDGFVFRVDMRLRPFGQSGPLVVTYHALEEYYVRHGREWERYALIKARVITGRTDDKEILRSLLMPFVYRRYIDFSAFESLREMKAMIAREVRQKKKENNVKLGAGGIREIEFLAQAFQLLRGGKEPQLQERQVQKVLAYLGKQSVLSEETVDGLLSSYDFLRRTEHRIQQVDDQQSHKLPDSDFLKARLAFGMNYSDWTDFSTQLKSVRAFVHEHFEELFKISDDQNNDTDRDANIDSVIEQLRGIWQATISEEKAITVLSDLGYQDGMSVIHLLTSFRESHRYRKMSKEGSNRLDKLMPLLIEAIALVDDSETTFKRIMDIIDSVCRRSVYLVLLIENPQGLKQLVKLCAASSRITHLLSRYPALFDELLDSRTLYAPLDKKQLSQELEEKLSTIAMDDLEQRMEQLRHFKQSQILRIAASDIVGLIPVEKVSDYLTWLAEVIVDFVLQTAWHDLMTRFGEPQVNPHNSLLKKDEEKAALEKGFGILGFGKMGGIELGYSSDLDMVFIFSDDYVGGVTDGINTDESSLSTGKSVDNLQFYSKLSFRIMHILQTQTHSGILYEADIRLRPNGNSGLITSSLKSFREYQLEKAWTWEHQALVRARFISGDERLISDFNTIRQEVLSHCRETEVLKKEVRDMREKMRQSLAQKRKGYFDIKQDFGGVADIEFIVQYMVLKEACNYPQLLAWTDNQRILEMLAETALLSEATVNELSQCYLLFRERLHQLSLQEVSGLVSEEEFKTEREKIQQHWSEIME
ncbi:MAG: bifunctional [glutamate--ammonia ligase]-adenylyl-L-tyrosine phosphorylase/[glutamate--ammonia-ligase] adenylyltransferase [Gammaproteobacteria bacterium]|nr:bifunctional [glutamate--ammonia ligase]-adenylyl-L-tyrosine phosphorylase/[glutamate--ammonia-ligase] adenylyltransferase [Gammaproteobacteria bacterium]